MIHRLILVGVVVSTVTIGFGAGLRAQQAAPAGFQQMVEIRVRPGHQGEFERFMRDLVAAANKINAAQTWTTFESAIGRDGAIYRIALPFATWGERERWTTPLATLAKASGQAQAEKMMVASSNWSDGVTTQIWENLPAGTSNPSPRPANFYQVTVREVKPDMVDEYQALTAKFKAAYEASPSKLTVLRTVLRIGPSPGNTFRRAEAFDKWSDLDGRSVVDILGKHYGQQEWNRMNQALQNMLIRQETFISVRRPELSRESAS